MELIFERQGLTLTIYFTDNQRVKREVCNFELENGEQGRIAAQAWLVGAERRGLSNYRPLKHRFVNC